ncbi:MAG: hypothetical protein Q9174_000037 [Haloplaca sp. 1 TL-2023]
MSRLLRPEAYNRVPDSDSDSDSNSNSESHELFDVDSAGFETHGLTTPSYVHRRYPTSSLSFISYLISLLGHVLRRRSLQTRGLKRPRGRTSTYRGLWSRRLVLVLQYLIAIIFALVFITAAFRPSYTKPPVHYHELKKSVLASKNPGRGNPRNESIYVAASIYDKGGTLVNGAWGNALLDLIDLLGSPNVFLSIYENDAGEQAEEALMAFRDRVPCANKIVYERHLSPDSIARVVLPDGSKRTKRIAYLAAVRNRALQPLDTPLEVRYEKLLFLNDVVFDPIEALQLLFSTNHDQHGRSSYLAACAVDFINPFKFYDTFATRDAEGYSMGVPIFPWFSAAGKGISRSDVLQSKDAVRVKSCWGGMVAFDASFFQARSNIGGAYAFQVDDHLNRNRSDATLPVRFRGESDLYWEASECCLVHADLQRAAEQRMDSEDVGIYMNPYVRVAYSSATLRWLAITRRVEKLFSLPHRLVNSLARMPRHNPRRTEVQGKDFKERVWVADPDLAAGGSFQEVNRVAESGGYCGFRTLQLMREASRSGEKNWETMTIPPGE